LYQALFLFLVLHSTPTYCIWIQYGKMPDQDICTDLGDKDLDLVLSLLLQLEE